MNRFTLVIVACASLVAIACITPMLVRADEPTTKPTTMPSVAVNKLCPVTKEAVDPSVATTDYKGKTIGFCCSDCVKSFKANPEKYMADLK